jgi:DNA polymerase elongation subunit (family B)
MSRTGWLLDCNVDWEKQALTLWIKENEKTKGYTYRGFNPSVFVSTDLLESNDWTETGILRAVREHPKVTDLKLVEKFASVYDKEKTQVLKVSTTPDALREVAGDLEKLPGATVYHADIDPVQQFFIDQTLFAFGRVEFELKGTDEVTKISSLDERENPEYDIPELEELGWCLSTPTRYSLDWRTEYITSRSTMTKKRFVLRTVMNGRFWSVSRVSLTESTQMSSSLEEATRVSSGISAYVQRSMVCICDSPEMVHH